MQTKKVETLSVAGLFLTSMIWGMGFIFSKFVLNAGLSPAAVMLGRFTLSTLLVGILLNKTIRQNYQKGQWKSGIVIGSFLFFAFFVQTSGLNYTTPSNSAFITCTYVMMVPFLWWLITKQRPTPVVFISCVFSLVGVAILSLNFETGVSIGFGDAITLLSAFLFALHIVATGMLAKSIHPVVLVFMQFAVSAVLSLGLFLFTDRDFSAFVDPQGVVGLLYLGVFSTTVCYFLQTFAQKHLPSAKVGVILATESVFGTLFSVIAGYDILSPRMVAGGLLMFGAIVLPELWSARKKEHLPN